MTSCVTMGWLGERKVGTRLGFGGIFFFFWLLVDGVTIASMISGSVDMNGDINTLPAARFTCSGDVDELYEDSEAEDIELECASFESVLVINCRGFRFNDAYLCSEKESGNFRLIGKRIMAPEASEIGALFPTWCMTSAAIESKLSSSIRYFTLE